MQQKTKIGGKLVKEYWEPKTEDLESLVVTRQVPTIHILLTLDRESGGGRGGFLDQLWGHEHQSGGSRRRRNNKRPPNSSTDKLAKDVNKINLNNN